jgi:hypothetical protein
MNLIVILTGIIVLFCLGFLFYNIYQSKKWYNRGYNEIKKEILKWLKGERFDKPFVENPYYVKKSKFAENNWWHKGAYDAYQESQTNGVL